MLTLKSATGISHTFIIKYEQVFVKRWHLDVRLQDADQVDAKVAAWPRNSFELAG